MKTAMTAAVAAVLLMGSAAISTASAGIDLTAEREARTARIAALKEDVRIGRMSRSDKVQAINEIARLEAEARKERRKLDVLRGQRVIPNQST